MCNLHKRKSPLILYSKHKELQVGYCAYKLWE